uniref:Serpentine receptor class gamma n=1 Tax=Strongyloides venezuelensis TaxID=75913 RepID=A0A0K0G691_STRVS
MVDMILVVEIIQLLYKIPSTLLMILSIYVIIKEIKNKNAICKLTNEIFFIITTFIFVRFPKWGFYNDFMEKNDWTATTFYVIGTQQTTFTFLTTLLISINRCIAVKYPLSYKHHFSRSKIIIILLCFIILSTTIGLIHISSNVRYKKTGLYDYFAPYLESKNVIYYQIFYQLFLFGTISIVTCIFNVMAVLTLKKHNKTGNKCKRNLNYIKYSIFIFITLFIVETFFICKFFAENYKIKFLSYITIFLHVVGFDLTSVGDFYFLLYSSSELRRAIKNVFGCSKKFNKKVNTKVIYRRRLEP